MAWTDPSTLAQIQPSTIILNWVSNRNVIGAKPFVSEYSSAFSAFELARGFDAGGFRNKLPFHTR